MRRSAKIGSHKAFYQYLDAKGCKGALHMSCVKCGKTFHMADSNATLFAKHLAQNEQFYACIISDATACCAEGMEFVLKDDLAYPAITRSWGRSSPSSVNFSPMKKTG